MPMNWYSSPAVRVALVVFVAALLPSALFGVRTFRSFELLQSPYAAGAPKTSSIRPWMTLGYVAATYPLSQADVMAALSLAADTDPKSSLKSLADRDRVSPLQYAQRTQRAVAARIGNPTADTPNANSGRLGKLADSVLTALLIYGYPVLVVSGLIASGQLSTAGGAG